MSLCSFPSPSGSSPPVYHSLLVRCEEFGDCQWRYTCLQLVLRGVACSPSSRGGTCPRLPITGVIMHWLVEVWSGDVFESRQMLAATCVGYFRFMRAGKFTAVGTAPPSILLSEVAINSRLAPTAVCLQLCRAKTDPFGRRVEIFLGVLGTAVYPITALMRYLAVHPSGDG